jgi:hypothetical protein
MALQYSIVAHNSKRYWVIPIEDRGCAPDLSIQRRNRHNGPSVQYRCTQLQATSIFRSEDKARTIPVSSWLLLASEDPAISPRPTISFPLRFVFIREPGDAGDALKRFKFRQRHRTLRRRRHGPDLSHRHTYAEAFGR